MSNNYKKKQNKSRRIQYWYGMKLYSFPLTFKRRIKAFSKLFNIGEGLSIGQDVFIYRTHGMEGKIAIGKKVVFAEHVRIEYSGSVIIEDKVVLSEGVRVYSHKHDPFKYTRKMPDNAVPVETVIKEGAWIGAGAIVLPGVTIGEYAVVGAGAVVTHDVLANTFVAGNPAKEIRKISENE